MLNISVYAYAYEYGYDYAVYGISVTCLDEQLECSECKCNATYMCICKEMF